MAGTRTTNRGALAVLLLAIAVLLAGTVAALAHDDGGEKATTAKPSATSAPTGSSTTTTARATTTTTTKVGAATTTTTGGATTSTTAAPAAVPTTTALPAVPTPEQAANGLFAAYRAGDRAQAARFATQDVISVLFAQPYSTDATFGSCTPDGDLYRCRLAGADSTYDMTVQRNPSDNSFLVVVITVSRPPAAPATSAPASP